MTCRPCASSPGLRPWWPPPRRPLGIPRRPMGAPRRRPGTGRAVLTRPFAEALAEAEKIIAAAPHVKSERDLAEGLDYLAGSAQACLHLAWSYSRDFPF